MTMRILHVIESPAPDGMEAAFLDLLPHLRAEDASVDHEVVALRSVDAAAVDRFDIAQFDIDQFDVAHLVSERCAWRVLPELVARSRTPVVFGKGYDIYDLPGGRTTILGAAADLARFQSIPAPPVPSTLQRIVCVAELHPRRRLDDLAQALERVQHDVPGAELRLVGREDFASELDDARILALPSWGEGVPAAMLQGMAAGRPVVAADHGGAIVDHGVEGFLVVPGDVESLADRLTRLLLDRPLAAAMGQRARTRSADHDVRVVARRLLRALRLAA